ncbi:MAG: hypothetical protein ABJ314_08175 [Ilumatobacter sp.]|uniref:hypothetical protein n=1 Tax=Ilumatobacter sp. TaxID=1967498 RepID=UPI00329945CE
MVAEGHRVQVAGYDEPGVSWTMATCSCRWERPLRVRVEQATIDAARHLHDPDRTEFGADWHDEVGPERARFHEQFRAVLKG